MNKIEKVFEKLMPYFLKFANSKPTLAIKDGFLLTMPLTLVGSIFLLIGCMPIPGWDNIMTNTFGAGWADPIWQVVGSTFDILALVGVFGVAYTYAKNEGVEGISAGVLGIVSLLIVTNSFVITEAGERIGGVIPKAYMGGKGMISAIIIGISVGYIYSWFIKRDIRIKMPEGVPQGVANAFSALIPGFAIITLSSIVFLVFDRLAGVSFIEVVYDVLQTPIQNMTDSLAGAILIPLLISLFWWGGIHGSAIIMGIMGPIVTANGLANQAIIDSGAALVVGENAKIVTAQFVDQYLTFGGAGLTLGLVLAMILRAKSAHLKQLGKLSIVPALFNINEPVLFGMPIVFNPLMLIPFIGAPLLSSLILYTSISLGFMPPFGAVVVPWTTPPIIGGFIVGGWKGALMQIIIILMSASVYYPFMKMQDQISYSAELEESDATK
ncbi:PTS sugar transporter subunit IIC [Alkalithermobacter paradoxus]|uniref:Permease IIC component n=1 Tax=Alkalithermobacter paradoxus TaxID=29349 RepID=A0A1V4I706_9FIRM|nr:lichenan permease IIC component [[Clostridium] thermoalcaliphilum]